MPKQVIDREGLVSQAYAIASRDGISALSVRKVASACGIAVGSVYGYFPTKADLTAAVLTRFFEENLSDELCVVRPGERFTSYVRRFREALSSARAEMSVDWFTEMRRLPSAEHAALDAVRAPMPARPAYRQLFASVFTDFHIFEQLVDGIGADAAQAQIARWLDHLQLDEKVKIEQNRILNSKLSQGQKKRLGLLAAALENRSIIILDEWAADQDPQFRRIFYEQLLPLLKQSGSTIFAISHDDKYFHHAERVISMKQGVLSELDSETARAVADEHSRAGQT